MSSVSKHCFEPQFLKERRLNESSCMSFTIRPKEYGLKYLEHFGLSDIIPVSESLNVTAYSDIKSSLLGFLSFCCTVSEELDWPTNEL